MLLIIDNYDSFTYNLVQYFGELGAEPVVKRNDEISIAEIEALRPEAVVISPGPCTTKEAGISNEVIAQIGPRHRIPVVRAVALLLMARLPLTGQLPDRPCTSGKNISCQVVGATLMMPCLAMNLAKVSTLLGAMSKDEPLSLRMAIVSSRLTLSLEWSR